MRGNELGPKAKRDASKLRVGIVVARFNQEITDSMLAGARTLLNEWGVKERNISEFAVSGSFELPFAAQELIRKKKPHAIVAIGCIVKGETEHDRHIASSVAQGLTSVSLASGIPVALGVLTVNTLEQAKARSRGKTNYGYYAASAALTSALDAKAL